MVEERRAHPKEGQSDLLGHLLAAHDGESGTQGLTDRELMGMAPWGIIAFDLLNSLRFPGNIFTFFFGGHEVSLVLYNENERFF